MHLLGGVDEQEEERERARGDGAQLERERLDLVEQLVERGRVRVAMAARAARLAERLDRVERLLALEARITRPSAAASQRTSSCRGTSSDADASIARRRL